MKAVRSILFLLCLAGLTMGHTHPIDRPESNPDSESVLWVTANEGTAVDWSPVGNTVTVSGSWSSGDGIIGGGHNFNGSNQSMSRDASVLGLGGPSAVTVMAWVKRDRNGQAEYIWAIEETNILPHGFLRFDAGDEVTYKVTDGSNFKQHTTTATITDTLWHHIVGVYDMGTIKVYIDGVDESGSTSGSLSGAAGPWTTFLRFANRHKSTVTQDVDWLDGRLDEIAILTRALSAAEVNQAHQLGRAGE